MTDKTGGEIVAALRANAKRRQRAEAQLEADRQELAELLAAGLEDGFSVTDLAAFAQISRETAYQHLAKRGKR